MTSTTGLAQSTPGLTTRRQHAHSLLGDITTTQEEAMSNASTTAPAPQRLAAAIAVAAIAIGALAVSYYPFDQAEDGGPRAILLVSGVVLALTAVVFGKALDHASARTAYWLAGLSLITLPVLWLGPPLVLGPAAILLGRETKTTPAIAIGALATLVALAGAVIG
jgi:hypothetical protein